MAFDNKKIQEAAYYIWKNNGCPANTSARDWQEAVEQLERQDALAMANMVSAKYRACTMIPDFKLNLSKIGAAKSPYLVIKNLRSAAPAVPQKKVAASTTKAKAKASKKSK